MYIGCNSCNFWLCMCTLKIVYSPRKVGVSFAVLCGAKVVIFWITMSDQLLWEKIKLPRSFGF